MARLKASMAEGDIYSRGMFRFCCWMPTMVWCCGATSMGCWWKRWKCWWGVGRCEEKISHDSCFSWSGPPICIDGQHCHNATLDAIRIHFFPCSIIDVSYCCRAYYATYCEWISFCLVKLYVLVVSNYMFYGKFDIGHFQISDLGYCRCHIVDSGYFKVLDF